MRTTQKNASQTMIKVFDIYIDGEYQGSVIANGKKQALQRAEQEYPHVLDDDVLELKERKIWGTN